MSDLITIISEMIQLIGNRMLMMVVMLVAGAGVAGAEENALTRNAI